MINFINKIIFKIRLFFFPPYWVSLREKEKYLDKIMNMIWDNACRSTMPPILVKDLEEIDDAIDNIKEKIAMTTFNPMSVKDLKKIKKDEKK